MMVHQLRTLNFHISFSTVWPGQETKHHPSLFTGTSKLLILFIRSKTWRIRMEWKFLPQKHHVWLSKRNWLRVPSWHRHKACIICSGPPKLVERLQAEVTQLWGFAISSFISGTQIQLKRTCCSRWPYPQNTSPISGILSHQGRRGSLSMDGDFIQSMNQKLINTNQPLRGITFKRIRKAKTCNNKSTAREITKLQLELWHISNSSYKNPIIVLTERWTLHYL